MCGTKPVVSVFVLSLSVAALAVAAYCAEQPKAATVTAPAVSSVKQFTHDGIAKTNLISDESHLYVTEWLAARHVVIKYSINGADHAFVPVRFNDFQALDISRDHSSLLIAPKQGSADNAEFWSLPLNAGAPHKIGELAGRDASWSADGTHLTYGKGSSLYIANADGTGTNGAVGCLLTACRSAARDHTRQSDLHEATVHARIRADHDRGRRDHDRDRLTGDQEDREHQDLRRLP